MYYPIWNLEWLGGGTLIAVVAILHVYIAHLAVGGGLFIWLLDRKAFLTSDRNLNDFLGRYNWTFLLVTMVFGGVSGVGIWWTIALVHPVATSSLIHNFVFGWATEWVFFLGEIIALLIYHYYFNRLERKDRLNIAFIYAVFAWLSLFVINGILSYMLTPGKWIETGNFWHGFFNPTFLPSLIFRTFVAVLMSGLFALLVGSYQHNENLRQVVAKAGVKWLIVAFLGMIPSAIWYYYSIPTGTRQIAFNLNPEMGIFLNTFLIVSAVLFILGLTFALRIEQKWQKTISYVLITIGLVWIGSFEYTREASRKPYVIHGHIYSNAFKDKEPQKSFVKKVREPVVERTTNTILDYSPWAISNSKHNKGRATRGRDLFNQQCLSCHTINGIYNDIVPRVDGYPYLGILSQLIGMGKVQTYMPPFHGTERDETDLAIYLLSLTGENYNPMYDFSLSPIVNGKVDYSHGRKADIPEFDSKKGNYVLLAWNDLGMHCISDSDPWFVILPPANTLEAQLIKRGNPPQILTENVHIEYKAPPEFLDPASRVQFWDHVESNFGKKLPENIGLAGNGMNGELHLEKGNTNFVAHAIPVVPYDANDNYNPYPVFDVTAYDANTGEKLAHTRTVAPTTTEMGCRNCHGGDWKHKGAGIAGETAVNILKAHDRLNGTDLYKEAKAGRPRLCQSCHADPALSAPGKPDILTLSASIHGWHANYMPTEGFGSCVLCHPSHPQGSTQCLRSIHRTKGIGCTNCHGELADHAISLLKNETEKPSAKRLMENLEPRTARTKAEIKPRAPWLNEPDCLNCHVNFEQPAPNFSSFNKWVDSPSNLFRKRTGGGGIRCEACHGAPHAIYPARNNLVEHLDNIQPMQYQGNPYPIGSNINCMVCHTRQYDISVHHRNMLRMVRNEEK